MVSSMAPGTRRKSTGAKVRENRLRRMADRQGYKLMKSPRRDPRALDYDCWQIIDTTDRGRPPAGDGFTMSLDDIEGWLAGGER
jgi:hypothetical protein